MMPSRIVQLLLYIVHFFLRTSKILPRLNVLIFSTIWCSKCSYFVKCNIFFYVENRLQRPSGVYVCPVFSSRTCVHARHAILMVLHVLYQVIVRSWYSLRFDNINCGAVLTACHVNFSIFFSFTLILLFFLFFNFFLNFHFSLKLFLICSYFSGDLSLTGLIKCVLNKKKSVVLKTKKRYMLPSSQWFCWSVR